MTHPIWCVHHILYKSKGKVSSGSLLSVLPRLSTVLFRYVTLDTEEICRRAFDVAKPHYLLSITSSYLSGKWPEK